MLTRRERAILAALGDAELPGREIAKRAGCTYISLYLDVRDLCERGLVVVVRHDEDDCGPFRVFAATRDGKRALADAVEAGGAVPSIA